MNRRCLIRISLIAIFLICILLCHGYSVRYKKRFETMTLDILSNPPSWQRLLSDATIEQSVSEERVRELLSENSNYIRAIDYDSEYSGIYLLTKQMFPSKEGILISALNIEPIPLAHDTGTEIELLGSANGLFLYRLHYYWD